MSGPSVERGPVVLIGLGGLGCPAALALATASDVPLVLVDDDVVDASNLHRQVLYAPADVGRHKLDAARDALIARGCAPSRLTLIKARFLPETAAELVALGAVLVEGADNFATKFLAADAAFLGGKPVIHGAAIRWRGTAWAVSPVGAPCYRCLFESAPDDAPNCATAGVMGPVVGLVGMLLADLALRVLAGDSSAFGSITSFDGRADRVRTAPITARPSCPLCGQRRIDRLIGARYTGHLVEPW